MSNIKLFENKKIRSQWDGEKKEILLQRCRCNRGSYGQP